MHTYFLFLAETSDYFCGIERTPDSLRDIFWRFMEGDRVGPRYPGNVEFEMGQRYPGIVVPDLLQNSLGYCLVSARLKVFLETHSGAEIEFLRFDLRNKKRRKEQGDHFIANVIGSQDCVDVKRSDGLLSESEPGTFLTLNKLYLDERKIPSDARLFRILPKPQMLIIRDDLKQMMEQHGFTGIRCASMGESLRE